MAKPYITNIQLRNFGINDSTPHINLSWSNDRHGLIEIEKPFGVKQVTEALQATIILINSDSNLK